MCDAEINPGLIPDALVSRRNFVVGTAVAAGLAAPALAATGDVVERDVAIPTGDGTADAALFHPAGKGRWPAVLVWSDIMGLRPVFRDMGRRLAAAGHVVLVPNPFYRSQRAPVVSGAVDFSKPEDRARLFGFRAKITDAGADGDAAAYLRFLDAQPQTDGAKRAGVQGYCMGGALAFRTAAAVPARIGAVASFHGGGLVTPDPNSPHRLIARTRAAYLVAIARNDDAKEPDAKTALRAEFARTKRPAVVEVYDGDHGWCVPGSAAYAAREAERAWTALGALYRKALV